MLDALAFAAAGWGVLMAFSPLLQIRRILVRRSSADVSLASMVVLQVGFALWIAYGASIGNWPLVIPNSIAALVGIALMAIAWRYRKGAGVGLSGEGP
jgi:MtN3 and saliva related transmembrane protein